MNVADRAVVVTGAAGGIGRELVLGLARAGARVAATDLRPDALERLAYELGDDHLTLQCDVTDAAALGAMLTQAQAALGAIDILVANAGVAVGGGLLDSSDETWDLALDVNLRHHIVATRALLPAWLQRGEGYFVAVASAAGLLTQIGSAPYAVSKHAAVAFAEWLSVTYGSRGIRVTCVCPMGVDTEMLRPGRTGALEELGASAVRAAGDVLSPIAVAEQIIDGIRDERFLITPHPEVVTFLQRKATDYDRWLAGMRRLQDQVSGH